MIKIEDFWKIDDDIKRRYGKKWYNFVDYCGLNPVRPLENYNYSCTPKNSMTFAATGIDGVHFGIINKQKSEISSGPIVITVPIATKNNIVVAEDLDEFFSLGYYVGWLALEQLVYNFEDTISYYSKPDLELDAKEKAFLELISNELNINHIPLSRNRLKELDEKYFKLLEIKEDQEFDLNLLKPEHKKMVLDFFEEESKKKK
ncbi:hypothetical protein QQ008_11320 [Fulvivirgaceae bacterium BMA10]|uniref:Type I restriction modification DNA specificity domain-containing protein n=1 Tax=Splendidivirga corallicola TaxID=3051826 RepID=A0ABT8KML4_9BACT|nr:hypothetical protein [Fulvivirgaceae bacterium BMA10]